MIKKYYIVFIIYLINNKTKIVFYILKNGVKCGLFLFYLANCRGPPLFDLKLKIFKSNGGIKEWTSILKEIKVKIIHIH